MSRTGATGQSAVRPALPALTGLRFFAAAHVLLFHYVVGAGFAVPAFVMTVASTGQAGVSMFFVLSGFILTYAYMTADGGLRGSAASFWRARVARIYPVYLFALLVAFPLLLGAWMVNFGLSPGGIARFLTVLFASPLLLQAWTPGAELQWNGPGWSLSVEAFFYLVFPFLLPRLTRMPLRRAWLLAATLWAATAALRVAHVGLGWDQDDLLRELFYKHPLLRLPDFVAGIVACRWFLERNVASGKLANSSWLAAVSGGLLLLVLGTPWVPPNAMNTTLLIPLYAMLFVGLTGSGALTRVVGCAPLRYLGEISYALYLLHAPVHVYISQAAPMVPGLTAHGPAVAVLATAASLALAAFAYRFIEIPWRTRLRSSSSAGEPREPAVPRAPVAGP